MRKYKFDGDRYATSGVAEEMPIELQMFLWKKIDGLLHDNVELDYLQVFNISRHGNVLRIEHEQEMIDPFSMVYLIDLENGDIEAVEGKVFVIDDVDHSTMLWASEY